ncbi:hypothetical protein HETIRDRAFT_426755 [Heterobasidion irregulare TC 32-1]|uniref:Uncharacterized protein n=1 Tax=Heterobasidion irregulare (strain TC 32-1) TaxID=747525 RepID=W4K8A6_HETIT|nr:uncharacterized protein HETIRDRAFT_426755 [Heterobasidion irregulare TC 32-1]ETW81276.1 hypothetical protein HETIRDRAFT_426755 [Heterobasidion irregulare TC 32-1]
MCPGPESDNRSKAITIDSRRIIGLWRAQSLRAVLCLTYVANYVRAHASEYEVSFLVTAVVAGGVLGVLHLDGQPLVKQIEFLHREEDVERLLCAAADAASRSFEWHNDQWLNNNILNEILRVRQGAPAEYRDVADAGGPEAHSSAMEVAASQQADEVDKDLQ